MAGMIPVSAKANQTIDDLKGRLSGFNRLDEDFLDDIFENGEDCGECLDPHNIYWDSEIVRTDLKAVDVDCENIGTIGEFRMPGTEGLTPFEVVSGIPILWCACGGDWQEPLVFVLYVGEDDELHAYIPDMGNVYDHQNFCAYEPGDISENEYVFDASELRKDVGSALTKSEPEAELVNQP